MRRRKTKDAVEIVDAIGYAMGRIIAVVIANPNASGAAISEKLDDVIHELKSAGDGRSLFAGAAVASALDGLTRGRFS